MQLKTGMYAADDELNQNKRQDRTNDSVSTLLQPCKSSPIDGRKVFKFPLSILSFEHDSIILLKASNEA